MDELQRLNVKLFVADPASLTPEEAARAFSAWIPSTTDEVLVDVADYTHVPHGPATVLVGHEANYVLDEADGRRGLIYARKQPLPGTLEERLAAVLAAALRAARRLEEDPALAGRVRFRGEEAALTANDRRRAPNTPAARHALEPVARSVLTALFAGRAFTVEWEPDPRRRLSLRACCATALSTAEVLAGLTAGRA